MYDRKYSSRESEPQTWYFVPAQHADLTKSVVSFRNWNIVIIAILGMMVLGLMLFAIVPPPPAHSSTAHAPLKPPPFPHLRNIASPRSAHTNTPTL
jgi:hypothetical protein